MHFVLVSTMSVVASFVARRSRLNATRRCATAGCKLERSYGSVGTGAGAGVGAGDGAGDGAGVFDCWRAPLVGVDAPTGVELVGAGGGAGAEAGVVDGYGLL